MGGVAEGDGEVAGVGVAAIVGEGGFLVGDLAAGVLFVFAGEAFGGEGEEAGAGEGVEEVVELIAVETAEGGGGGEVG